MADGVKLETEPTRLTDLLCWCQVNQKRYARNQEFRIYIRNIDANYSSLQSTTVIHTRAKGREA
jgi:hypothetical protein